MSAYLTAVVGLTIATVTPRKALAQVAGELRGRVTVTTTSRPVAGSRVEVSGRTETVRTDPDGSFEFRGLEPRPYTVTVRALGYAVVSREVEVSNGRVTTLDVAITPLVSVLSDVLVRATRDTSSLNTTSFNRLVIEQSGRRDLAELLQNTPGIVITQFGGPGQPSRVSIRGSSANQVLVLVDGVPFNSAISGTADLSQISLETVDNITIRTGAQSARYGPGAMAGVIEVATRKMKRELSSVLRTGAIGERVASASLANTIPVASTSVGASIMADYHTVRGDFAYDVPAVRGGGRARRINSDATSRQILGGLSLEGSFGNAALRGTWQQTERGLAGTIVQQSSTGRQANSRWSSGAYAQGSASAVAWTGAVDFTREIATFVDKSPPFGQAFNDTLDASGVTASASATVGSEVLSLSSGGEVRTLSVESSMLDENAPRWQRQLGAWANTRYRSALPFAGWQLDAELGGRVDHNSLSREAALSPRAAVRIARGVLATSVSLGSGYAPPTLAQQFFHEGVQVQANPNLQPERTRRDLEGRITLREINMASVLFSGQVAAYRSNIEGMILWLPNFQFVWSPSNYNVNRSGWELSGTTRLPSARVELQSTLNRSDVTYAGGVVGGQVAYRPRNTANVTMAFAPGIARLEITNRYIGVRRTVAGSALNALAPYWRTDARISSSFSSRSWTFGAAFGVDNVANRAAAMLVDYPFPPRMWSLSLRVRRKITHSS